MGSRFQGGLDRLEVHLEDFKKRFDSLEARMDSLEGRLDSLEARMDSLEDRMDSLESRMISLKVALVAIESKHEAHHHQFLRRLDQIDGDLKRFVGLVNDTILHYADEMDSVRQRLDILEKRVGILPASE